MEKPAVNIGEYIEYQFGFNFNGRTYAFKKKNLFDITDQMPKFIKQSLRSCGSTGWYLGNKWLSMVEAKSITQLINKKVPSINFRFDVWCALNNGMEPFTESEIIKPERQSRRVKYSIKTKKEMKLLIKELRTT